MPTMRQKRAAKLVVENLQADKPLTGGEIVERSGFGKSMKLYPGRILESKGVQEELRVMGFDPVTAAKVTSELMRSKKVPPRDRLRAVDITFKVHGTYAPEKKLVGISDLRQMSDDDIARRIEELRAGTV